MAQLNTTELFRHQAKLEEAVCSVIRSLNCGRELSYNEIKDILYKWDNLREASWFITDESVLETYVKPTVDTQAVLHPKHYEIFPGVEAIEVIAASMTKEEFRGYCKGNMLKYRLRAGNKDPLEQDIAKANTYLELYAKYEYLAG